MADEYEYKRLQDAMLLLGKKVSFYGAVSQFEQPKKTSAPDMFCTMTVEDMSSYSPGLRVIVFSSTVEGLPQVKAIGDVIRFHRAVIVNRASAMQQLVRDVQKKHSGKFVQKMKKIKSHKDVPQAVVRIKVGASFLIFDGINGIGYTPYQESSKNYTMKPNDHQQIDLIRDWVKRQPMDIGLTEYLVPISGINDGNYFDLCCKILHVDKQESNNAIILYVWDGTDAPPAFLTVSEGREGRDRVSSTEINVEGVPTLKRDIISSFPPVGTVLPIVLNLEENPIQPYSPGNWVKFRNLTCRVHSGIYETIFLRESKLSLLSSRCELVEKREREFQRRILDADRRLPQSALKPLHSLTVTDYEHVPFSTLREVLTYPEVTYKFHCVVRVVSTLPTRVRDFCVPVDPEMLSTCNECEGKTYVYRVRLTLEDPTARIYAYLCFEDAERFFNGHPATDLHDDSASVGALERKVQKLLGFEENKLYGSVTCEARFNPPWIKCCVKSYYLHKENPWGSRRFRIFGTVLL